MTMVTLGISSVEDAKTRMLAAFQGEAQGAFIGFATAELLWKVITPKRWAVLRAMTGAGSIAIRKVARRVGRDVNLFTTISKRSPRPVSSIAPRMAGSFFPMTKCTWVLCCAPLEGGVTTWPPDSSQFYFDPDSPS